MAVAKMTRKARLTLAALIAVCVLPVAASYLAFYVWPPSGRSNYGALVTPTPLPDGALGTPAGGAFARDDIKGFWTYVVVAPAACDEACRQALYFTRQVRTAQAKESPRVARVWLLSDDGVPDAALLAEHPELVVARAERPWLDQLDGEAVAQVWLADPRGQVMMRYPTELDPKGMIKDLARLLKYSQVG